eukprot:TRINITY_DN7327_c0_g1_i2.p1 TRINITY_DN7327_c0_g1~~TRINITY_DN7327_c0_g1_i2.p1  ORF type:complete len:361 (-),score=99.86 TRINITY_DN7327_c0_g1_i2:27-1109(-)
MFHQLNFTLEDMGQPRLKEHEIELLLSGGLTDDVDIDEVTSLKRENDKLRDLLLDFSQNDDYSVEDSSMYKDLEIQYSTIYHSYATMYNSYQRLQGMYMKDKAEHELEKSMLLKQINSKNKVENEAGSKDTTILEEMIETLEERNSTLTNLLESEHRKFSTYEASHISELELINHQHEATVESLKRELTTAIKEKEEWISIANENESEQNASQYLKIIEDLRNELEHQKEKSNNLENELNNIQLVKANTLRLNEEEGIIQLPPILEISNRTETKFDHQELPPPPPQNFPIKVNQTKRVNRSLLDDIQNGIPLRKTNIDPVKVSKDNGILGILATALIDRRNNLKVDVIESEEELWSDSEN